MAGQTLNPGGQQFRKVVHSIGLGVGRLFFWVRPGPETIPSDAAHPKSEDTPPAWVDVRWIEISKN